MLSKIKFFKFRDLINRRKELAYEMIAARAILDVSGNRRKVEGHRRKASRFHEYFEHFNLPSVFLFYS